VSQKGSEIDDSASLTSYAPSRRVGGDLESLLGNGFNTQSAAWKLLNSQTDSGAPFETIEFDEDDQLSSFEREFDEVADVDSKEGNEGLLQIQILEEFKLISCRGVSSTMEI
jgi:hypothetical protein